MANASVLSSGQSYEPDFSLGLPEKGAKPEVARLAMLARHLNSETDASDQPIGGAGKRSPQSAPIDPTIQGSPGPASPGFRNDLGESDRSSFATRMFRSVARFFIVALIGAGVTLAWQSHGEAAKQMVRTQAPSLAWLFPPSTANSTSEGQVTPAAAQELKPMALDVAAVRRNVEQLAARQELMAAQQQQIAGQQERITQSLAALQALQQDIKQKVSSPPPSRTVTTSPRAAQSPAVQPSPATAQPPPRQPSPLLNPSR